METTNAATAAIIAKVQKLLALAGNNANVNEAAAAAARAQELLFKHKLSMADLEISTGEREAVGQMHIDEETALQLKWKSDLLFALAHGGFCRAIKWLGVRNAAGAKIARVIIVGKPSDAQTVSYLYQYARNEIDRLCKEEGRGKGFAWANSFRVGAVHAIWQRMKEQRTAQARSAANVIETALTIVNRGDADIADYIKQKLGKLKPAKGASASRGDAFEAGRKAGQGIGLGGGGAGLSAPAKRLATG